MVERKNAYLAFMMFIIMEEINLTFSEAINASIFY